MIFNEKRIFIRGVNWVPISPFYGNVKRKDYLKYLKRFKEMNCNLLRVWGGGILEKQDFYELCDEMGLMVWQEFPQSSSGINNSPPDNPEFIAELKTIATRYILKKRHHASHVIWCGGNELMNDDYKPVTEGHPNIFMLKNLVEEFDDNKYFLPCSASGPVFIANEDDFGKGIHHDVHGPWNYLDDPKHYDYFNNDDALFRSETGCPGMSRLETLNKYKGSYSLWPPDQSNPYWIHRGAWWIQKRQLEKLFGNWAEDGSQVDEYIKSSRYIQAESLRYSIESTRRREPKASGFIIWMGNEPFPNNSNTSVIEYDGTPKPSYYWIKKSFSKIHVSAKYEKIGYITGEYFRSSIYVTSEIKNTGRHYAVRFQIADIKGNAFKDFWIESEISELVSKVHDIEWLVQKCPNDIFILRVSIFEYDKKLLENTYLFTTDNKHVFNPLRQLPRSSLILNKEPGCKRTIWSILNNSDFAAIGVYLYGRSPGKFIEISDNYFLILPGEKKEMNITDFEGEAVDLDDICIEAFNL